MRRGKVEVESALGTRVRRIEEHVPSGEVVVNEPEREMLNGIWKIMETGRINIPVD